MGRCPRRGGGAVSGLVLRVLRQGRQQPAPHDLHQALSRHARFLDTGTMARS